MPIQLRKILQLLKHPSLTRFTCAMGIQGYLKDIGWINSYLLKMPVDNKNKPLPWVTYPFIDFIEDRLDTTMKVFEYGSGNSTLWYADRVAVVIAVEHDKFWYDKVLNTMPDNVTLNYQEIDKSGIYAEFAKNLNISFDIVIVDGRERIDCIKNAVDAIHSSGIIILDDSERDKYRKGIDFLKKEGFKQLDLWGIAPAVFFKKCTTVFYRSDNILGL